ncbi:hypothetical protein KXD40_006731 [Peronospora effusa]|uniref:VPS9 domain-containing protein n=1 Tax=Peronospora effusa TaxID=542832 RepID=A0A3M6VKN3_9STRA|nr:hypothetical protein DD238_003998 [Peronospora effusa]RQM17840.1 hypothetical protein DD237_002375 [Peronospora effusa]UIZ24885.1 hypothetical protein KXD40_006731 [Peronospora effusa]
MASSSSDEEVEVELLDSVSKINGALQYKKVHSTLSQETSDTSTQKEDYQRHEEETPVNHKELRRTNEQLRNQVMDLKSALVARDLEIVTLRDRCECLTTAIEQQDAVIAKIYASTGPTEATKGSIVTTLPVHTADKKVDQVKVDDLNDPYSNISIQKEKRTWSCSMKSDPVGLAEPAQKMLEAQLDLMGFQGESVKQAVESLQKELPTELEKVREDVVTVDLDQLPYTPHAPMNSNSLSESVSVYSSSSTPTVSSSSSSSSLFGDIGEPVLKLPQSWTSPRSGSIVKRRPSLERQDSGSTEEVFARSAGFLRKSNRIMSTRLSVRDLGLLCNDDDVDGSNQSPKAPPSNVHGQQIKYESDQNDSTEFADSGGSSVSTKSRSQRNLFAEVDEALKTKTKRKNAGTDSVNGDKADEDSLTYGEFLHRISQPASRDILNKIRMFVGSILGPRGDGRPPRSTDYIEYCFYGTHELRRRCNRFFESMGDNLLHHPAWRHVSDAKLAKARDGIEKYVMDKVSDIAFNRLKECHDWVKEDEALLRRMQLLSFITPAMLDIKPCMRNEVVWSLAEDELRRINSFRSPGEKINCIVRCCGVIFSVLNLSRGDSGSRPGADDFLPVFIYIVLHSQIPRLHSNCEYISAYRNQADLMSKAGYCFVNLRSAIEFIMVMDGSMLSIPDDEFQSSV